MENIENKVFDKIVLFTQSTATEELKFKQIFSLEPQYIGQAIQMSKVFEGAIEYVNIDGKNVLKFNFNKALDIVKNHPEMAVVGTMNQSVSQSSAEVSLMIKKVLELLKTILSVTLTPSQTENYKQAITQAFANLNVESNGAWIFWQKTEQHKTTYQYNILFAIQNEETGSVMLALPVALTITVDLVKEEVLWITIKDKQNYEVTVQAMEVVQALK